MIKSVITEILTTDFHKRITYGCVNHMITHDLVHLKNNFAWLRQRLVWLFLPVCFVS